MSLDTNISDLATRLSTEFNSLRSEMSALGGGGTVIGTVQPTPATGVSVLWIDTTGGNLNFKIVTGD